MSKNINVDAHINRYNETELSDVVKLISGLQELVRTRSAEAITELETKLALLKSGEVPVEAAKIVAPRTKKTRGGKEIPQPEAEA